MMKFSLTKGLSALLFLSTLAIAQTTGSFNILSYNVAGLPELLSSGNPDTNTPLISPRLKPYNVIHVQEDFNSHAALYASDTHAYRTSTSGGAGVGSGLNTLSDFPFVDLDRVKWSSCNLNSGDCLTPKGFTFMRVRVAEGVWIDFYNLHADAGDESGDTAARSSNFAQVSSYIAQWSQGMSVIVFGDTNTRWSRAVDHDTLTTFVSTNGFTDQWIKDICKGNTPASGSTALVCDFPFAAGTMQAQMTACEVVDKIFVRSNPALSITSTTFTNENWAFVNRTGAPLSDHYPISSTLTYQHSSALRMGDPIGGPHGTAYNDIPTGDVPKITTITVRGANRVDGISYSVKSPSSGATQTFTHDGTGGTASTLTLNSGERITQLYACTGTYSSTTRVFYISLTTNQGRTLTTGKTTSSCSTTVVPTTAVGGSWGLVGLWGRDGDEIDRVGAIWGSSY